MSESYSELQEGWLIRCKNFFDRYLKKIYLVAKSIKAIPIKTRLKVLKISIKKLKRTKLELFYIRYLSNKPE